MTGPEDSPAHGRALAGAERRYKIGRDKKNSRGRGAEATGSRPIFLPQPILSPVLRASQCAPGP